jgi:hypothetical protein
VRLIVVVTRGRGMAGLEHPRYGQASKTEPGRFGVPYSVLFNFCPPKKRPVKIYYREEHMPVQTTERALTPHRKFRRKRSKRMLRKLHKHMPV